MCIGLVIGRYTVVIGCCCGRFSKQINHRTSSVKRLLCYCACCCVIVRCEKQAIHFTSDYQCACENGEYLKFQFFVLFTVIEVNKNRSISVGIISMSDTYIMSLSVTEKRSLLWRSMGLLCIAILWLPVSVVIPNWTDLDCFWTQSDGKIGPRLKCFTLKCVFWTVN